MSSKLDPKSANDLNELTVLFRKFAQHAQRYEQAGLEKVGTTPARVHLLCELLQSGIAPMQSLANALSITPRSVTSLVDALEGEGKVVRTDHPTDRRSKLVSLTPLGKKEALVSGPSIRQHMASLFATLSVKERKSVATALQKLIDEMESRK